MRVVSLCLWGHLFCYSLDLSILNVMMCIVGVCVSVMQVFLHVCGRTRWLLRSSQLEELSWLLCDSTACYNFLELMGGLWWLICLICWYIITFLVWLEKPLWGRKTQFFLIRVAEKTSCWGEKIIFCLIEKTSLGEENTILLHVEIDKKMSYLICW